MAPDPENLRDSPRVEPQKSYHTILEQEVEQASEELARPAGGLVLSAVSAGLDLGFGPLLMIVVAEATRESLAAGPRGLAIAAAYTVGFVAVVLGRSALFTEQTTSAVLPVLAGRAGPARVLRLWGLVLAGNLVGAAAIAAAIAHLVPALGIAGDHAFREMAGRALAAPPGALFASAVLAGWLMGLLSWLVVAARDTTGQLLVVLLTTFVIGAAGLHHSIAGSIEVLVAVFAGAGADWRDYLGFAPPAIVGNAVGGSVFVALLKYGHVRASA
jgi:formate/nitrite transporter FocA (FNT family)